MLTTLTVLLCGFVSAEAMDDNSYDDLAQYDADDLIENDDHYADSDGSYKDQDDDHSHYAGQAEHTGAAGLYPITDSLQKKKEHNDDVLVQLEGITPTCQYPELPTGCEMTSLAITLNYYGLPADKCDLADHYLDKRPVGEADFYRFFVGDPRDESSFGCYAPVVVNTANRYLEHEGSEMIAYDYTGSELEDLFPFLDAGVPVIIWATLDLAEGNYTVTWTIDGKDMTWFSPEHCMVLMGYGKETVWVADPFYGKIRDFSKKLFEERYKDLHQQAVILQ